MPSPRPQVLLTDFVTDDLAAERTILEGHADITALNAKSEADLNPDALAHADALIVYHTITLTDATIAQLRNCRLIVRGGVGFDNIDIAAARERSIPVANIPDYGTEEVADSAIGLMLALTRGISRLNQQLRTGAIPWSHASVNPLYRLRGRTMGIVGLGRIGSAAALRAKAFGLDVVFYDPYRPDGADKALGLRRARTVEELFRQSHIVSLHCFLSPETRHLFNSETAAYLPHGAYLINTARGHVVDTGCLPGLLASGQLAGAALDVLPHEPPAPEDPLLRAWNDPSHPAHTRLILNSHSAFYCEEGLEEIRVRSAEACLAAVTGAPIRNVVS